jgi:hypothetical protein
MSRLYRITRKLLPAATQLAWSRSRIEHSYAKDIAAARHAKDYDEVRSLESTRRFELDMQDEEEDAHLTKRLRSKARRLRVPIPHSRNEDGTTSDQWYEGTQTGGWYFTDTGIKAMREEIRLELKARHESRAQLVVWLSALTGVIGTITGLIAVLAQMHG